MRRLHAGDVGVEFQGPSSGVALVGPQSQVFRWADGRLREMRVDQDGDQARRAYEHLTGQAS